MHASMHASCHGSQRGPTCASLPTLRAASFSGRCHSAPHLEQRCGPAWVWGFRHRVQACVGSDLRSRDTRAQGTEWTHLQCELCLGGCLAILDQGPEAGVVLRNASRGTQNNAHCRNETLRCGGKSAGNCSHPHLVPTVSSRVCESLALSVGVWRVQAGEQGVLRKQQLATVGERGREHPLPQAGCLQGEGFCVQQGESPLAYHPHSTSHKRPTVSGGVTRRRAGIEREAYSLWCKEAIC